VEVKKELVWRYLKTIKADPNTQSVEISFYPALFSQIIAGEGFEPPTSGL
jgi:hypothetical protein